MRARGGAKKNDHPHKDKEQGENNEEKSDKHKKGNKGGKFGNHKFNNKKDNLNSKNNNQMPNNMMFPWMNPYFFMNQNIQQNQGNNTTNESGENNTNNNNQNNPMAAFTNQINLINQMVNLEEDPADKYLFEVQDYTIITPTMYLEKPELLIKKNLFDANWFLLKNNKIIGNYNSEQLLYFLNSEFQMGNDFENMGITDYVTDMFFLPINLYDLLKKFVPKLKMHYLQSNINKEMEKIKNNCNYMMNFQLNQLMKNNNMPGMNDMPSIEPQNNLNEENK